MGSTLSHTLGQFSKKKAYAWTSEFPEDFHAKPTKVESTLGLSQSFAQGLDLMIRTSLSTVIAEFGMPHYQGHAVTNDLSQAVQLSELLTASEAHKPITLSQNKARRPFGVNRGDFFTLDWISHYTPDAHYRESNENKHVVARYWCHSADTPRPTIIFLHGFCVSNWLLNDYFMHMRKFYDAGYDIAFVALPHHGTRKHPASWLNGFDYVAKGIAHLNHSVVQSTYDIRALIAYLKNVLKVPKIGLCGMSLGGYTAALMAGLEDRLDFVMPVIPIISIPDAMLSWRPLDKAIRKLMQRHELELHHLRNTMAFHSPLSHTPVLSTQNLMIVAAAGDQMAPPVHAEQLQAHWGNCKLAWFEGSHVLPLGKNKALQQQLAFLEAIDF